VRPPKHSATASGNGSAAGFAITLSSARITFRSACAPIVAPGIAITASPERNEVTPAPTSSTMPASSTPRIGCRGPE